MNSELVLVLDFGGQYNQLIARRVRECNVYAEVIPYTTSLEDIKAKNPKGIIFTGGPNSVYKEDSPSYDKSILKLVCRFSESVTVHSLWHISWVEKSRQHRSASTERQMLK